jgi:hypothetical protein
MKRVFVSSSVPDPRRPGEEHYAETADNVAIRDAITALVEVVTPADTLVFGGHPAITPMVARVAAELGTLERVQIFQSLWFEPFFPPENRAFRSLVRTPRAATKMESLRAMRVQMLAGPFEAAVFIGGMKGVEDEFDAVCGRIPLCLPVATTGGAARVLAERRVVELRENGLGELFTSYNYVPLFRRLLGMTAGK